jgi:hypothetical protein
MSDPTTRFHANKRANSNNQFLFRNERPVAAFVVVAVTVVAFRPPAVVADDTAIVSLRLSLSVPLPALVAAVAFRAAGARLDLAVVATAVRVAALALFFARVLLDLTMVVVTLLLLASLGRES